MEFGFQAGQQPQIELCRIELSPSTHIHPHSTGFSTSEAKRQSFSIEWTRWPLSAMMRKMTESFVTSPPSGPGKGKDMGKGRRKDMGKGWDKGKSKENSSGKSKG